jgi:hypothetical protein
MSRPRSFVVAMFGISAVLGVLQAYVRVQHEDFRIVTLISLFTYAPLLFAWCKADAAHRDITSPPAAPLLVGLFALVGVPYYFLKSLPLRQAVVSIALAAGIFLLMLVTTAVLDMTASRVFAS